jgi:hypothetical protein
MATVYTIPLKDWASGVYLLVAQAGAEKIKTEKFVVR